MGVVSTNPFEQLEGGGSLCARTHGLKGIAVAPQGLNAPDSVLSPQQLRSEEAVGHRTECEVAEAGREFGLALGVDSRGDRGQDVLGQSKSLRSEGICLNPSALAAAPSRPRPGRESLAHLGSR